MSCLQVIYYLCSQASFKYLQLKFKLRTGVSGLGEDLYRQQRDPGLCKACGRFETLKHFLFQCGCYASPRLKMFNAIKDTYGDDGFSMFIQNQDFALQYLWGDHDDELISTFYAFSRKPGQYAKT